MSSSNISRAERQLNILGVALVTSITHASPKAKDMQLKCVKAIAKDPTHPHIEMCQDLCTKGSTPEKKKLIYAETL